MTSEVDKSEEIEKKKASVPNITLGSLIDPTKPWVLVPNGSFMDFFNWVPSKLRIGRWSRLAPIYILTTILAILYTLPTKFQYECTYPEAFSIGWFYNCINFFWMAGILTLSLVQSRAGVSLVITYTIQSWSVLTARHGLTALAPFLPKAHKLLFINEFLRFHALITATVTFVVWNFMIMPVIYFKFMETPKQKKDFLTFMTSFRLLQLHGFNIVFAALNTVIIAPRKFTSLDLWGTMSLAVVYSLFYLLVLDRLGIHLYPVFSPRSRYFVFTWTFAYGCYFSGYYVWNKVIGDYLLVDRFQ